ncbi:MAG: hypothetical protein NXI32_01825 [bacterium]|nr:hypothetical protein [bacterium]
MKNWLETSAKRLAACFGYRLERVAYRGLKRVIPVGAKLHVGCGEQDLDGYLGCDLRDLPNVQLVCRAWEVSQFCQGLSEIYSRHMLEHLTLREAELTLRDWHAALQPGGLVNIEVPNLEFHIAQWGRCEWNRPALEQNFSDTRWGFAGLYGWQRECDPSQGDYNASYWDVHKSGYTPEAMRFFLAEAGFTEIQIQLQSFSLEQSRRLELSPEASLGCHLIATGRKQTQSCLVAA